MSSAGQTLTQYDWCPYERVKFRDRHVKTQAEIYKLWDAKDGQETTRRWGPGRDGTPSLPALRRGKFSRGLELGLPAPRNGRRCIPVAEATQSVVV